MDLITLSITKNHLLTGLSIIGLGAISYLSNRYMKNTQDTSTQTYYKPSEQIKGIPNLKLFSSNSSDNSDNSGDNIIYIFWNGDIKSTYLLVDLLLQDKIIQPLFIERYTIIKTLEKDTLKKNLQHISKDNKMKKYLKNILNLKHIQEYDTKQIEIMRLMILGQYPEFSNNLLPTIYITNIQKDLEYTSNFYNFLQAIKPIHYDDIEFVEQIGRFIKHYNIMKKTSTNTSTNTPRILLGYNKNYKNIDILKKLKNNYKLLTNIDMPLLDMDNDTIKYISHSFLPNNIVKYFLS
jgi:hypothetical protein